MRIGKLVIGDDRAERIEHLLERIAIALEAQAGIALPGAEVPDKDRTVETAYSTEADLLREEWQQAVEHDVEHAGDERELDFLEQMREQSKGGR